MMKRMAVRISFPHTEYICMIRGFWSMWVRRNQLDCSAVVQSIGFITWDMKRRFRPCSSSSTTQASYCRTFRSYSSLLHPSTGRLQRSCASPLVGSRFRRMWCRRWRRPTVFDGWHTTWLPWDCGVHPVRKGCHRRRHATLACRAVTAFWIYLSSSV